MCLLKHPREIRIIKLLGIRLANATYGVRSAIRDLVREYDDKLATITADEIKTGAVLESTRQWHALHNALVASVKNGKDKLGAVGSELYKILEKEEDPNENKLQAAREALAQAKHKLEEHSETTRARVIRYMKDLIFGRMGDGGLDGLIGWKLTEIESSTSGSNSFNLDGVDPLIEGMPVVVKTTKRSLRAGLIKGTTEEHRGMISGPDSSSGKIRVKLHPRPDGGNSADPLSNDIQSFPKSAVRPDLTNRVRVASVEPASAAHRAGIREGDILVGLGDSSELASSHARQTEDLGNSNASPFSQEQEITSVRPVVAKRDFRSNSNNQYQLCEASDLGPQSLSESAPALLVLRRRKFRVLQDPAGIAKLHKKITGETSSPNKLNGLCSKLV